MESKWINRTALYVVWFLSVFGEANKSHPSHSQIRSHVAVDKLLGQSTKMLFIEKPWLPMERYDSSGEISGQCIRLLEDFNNATTKYLGCIMCNARPLRYCEFCIKEYTTAMNAYTAISKDTENNTNCQDQLVRADNVQVIFLVHDFIMDIWDKSACHHCYTSTTKNGTTKYQATNDTEEMLRRIQQVQGCFHDFADDHTQNISVCKVCKNFYSQANDYYNKLDEEGKLCSDLEDSMNYTRIKWSKKFKCTIAIRTDALIYGLTAAIGMIPIIFYLTLFLHGKRMVPVRTENRRDSEGRFLAERADVTSTSRAGES